MTNVLMLAMFTVGLRFESKLFIYGDLLQCNGAVFFV